MRVFSFCFHSCIKSRHQTLSLLFNKRYKHFLSSEGRIVECYVRRLLGENTGNQHFSKECREITVFDIMMSMDCFTEVSTEISTPTG